MPGPRFFLAFAVLTTASCLVASDYQTSLEEWRRRREARLVAEDGWLTVAGLFWLQTGANTLPAPAPAGIGAFHLRSGKIAFQPGGGPAVTAGSRPVAGPLELQPDVPGPPTVLTIGDLTLYVIRRGERFAVRLKDKNSKLRREFAGLRWFPADPAWRVRARFVPYPTPRMLSIATIHGDRDQQPSPGYAAFTRNGREHRLVPTAEGGRLFIVFRDLTAGKQTYPAGRFLYADMPQDGEVVLDFNQAYNPPCAFNPFTTCPVPLRENRLSFPVPAGEQYPPPTRRSLLR